ncbi:MAG: M14 family metallopeptidase [Opitutaceae bacterium]
MSSVKAAPFAPAELASRLAQRATAAGFRVETYGEAAGCALLALTRRTPGPRPRIYLSAGIHGDEPAPPLALLELLEAGAFDRRADWLICPLLNPAGFLRSTRENAEGVDLNRDYRNTRSREIAAHIQWLRRQPNFDLNLCLHEDWEAAGFYLYELNAGRRPSLAERIVAAVGVDFPIDRSELIDGRPAKDGILRPDPDPAGRELWPESIYLRVHHTRFGCTLETPSGLPLRRRIAAMRTAVTTALDLVLSPDSQPTKFG